MGLGYNLGRHGRYRVTRHSTRLKHHETIPLKTWSRHFKVKLWYRWWMVNQFVTSNAPFTKIMQHTFKVLRLPPSNEVIFKCPHDNTLIATQCISIYQQSCLKSSSPMWKKNTFSKRETPPKWHFLQFSLFEPSFPPVIHWFWGTSTHTPYGTESRSINWMGKKLIL